MEAYTTIREVATAEIVEKKSRFIAYIAPVKTEEEALAVLERIRAEHRMARHNVYAYVLREGGRVRYSDDGEPQKTAGLPTLEAIQHAGLSDVIVVVTRYFGGTLLGTGGLVRAYMGATQAAIEAAEKVQVSRCVRVSIEAPYALYDQLLYVIEQQGAKNEQSEFLEQVYIEVLILEKNAQPLVAVLNETLRGQGKVTMTKPFNAVF